MGQNGDPDDCVRFGYLWGLNGGKVSMLKGLIEIHIPLFRMLSGIFFHVNYHYHQTTIACCQAFLRSANSIAGVDNGGH